MAFTDNLKAARAKPKGRVSPDVSLPWWAVCLIGGWNAAVAALALSNTPSR